ncbi:hypothetical protein [Mesorhizobium muleiense]|uniref:Uncharacterized protein n=1 Tax=Mesorhizobium muleiense TaxID=1004279 RepID=A0A1G8LC19_9HYPH|nr:hypothetical protein [Mesorhizobium muleiense]MCF6100360.1 hypothetical protein [Mesorhizobium muleiense]SDI53196.1 hypothetical protein SAMN05428953_102202 [Mesorhizobium muleiense]
MSKSIEATQRELELIFNELSADQAVNRVIMQTLLLNMVSARGQGLLDGIKYQVLEGLRLSTPNEGDLQGGERKTQLTIMRAERFFQELEQALGAGSKQPSEGAH